MLPHVVDIAYAQYAASAALMGPWRVRVQYSFDAEQYFFDLGQPFLTHNTVITEFFIPSR